MTSTLIQTQEEMQKRYDTEKKEMESSYKKTIQQLETRLSDVENMNKVIALKSFT